MVRARVRQPGEAGQATPLVVAIVGLALLAAWLLAGLGAAALDRAKARTAADAAALAGAAEGERAAREIAEANGAVVVSFEQRGADVIVRVRLGRATASARARRSLVPATSYTRSDAPRAVDRR
jgi:uncharacterized membrane protein